MSAFAIYEKHPTADAYRVGGFYSPYALVSQDKRFSDAELAAEWHQQDCCMALRVEGYRWASDGHLMGSEEDEAERLHAIHDFAARPHASESDYQ